MIHVAIDFRWCLFWQSRLAEQTAISMQLAVTYVATAQALDPEMQSRIVHHQNQRPAHWSLVEEPLF